MPTVPKPAKKGSGKPAKTPKRPASALELRGDAPKRQKKSKSRGAAQSKVPGETNGVPHELARERKIEPYVKKTSSKPKEKIKNVEAAVMQRCRDFPGQCLVKVGSGPSCSLKCDCCGYTFRNPKKSRVEVHLFGQSREQDAKTPFTPHSIKLQSYTKRLFRDPTVAECLQEYDAKYQPVGTTLGEEVRPGRVACLRMLLETGVVPEKLKHGSFRSALEMAFKVPLTSPSHLLELIPVLTEVLKRELGAEINNQHFVSIYDGTTTVGEAFVFLWRGWIGRRVQHRVLDVKFLQRTPTAPEQVGLIVSIAANSTTPPVSLALNIGETLDSCQTNIATVPLLGALLHPGNLLNPCYSHFFSNCGKQADVPLVTTMVHGLTALQVSGAARSQFKNMYGEAIVGYSNIRWYVGFEQTNQQFLNWQVFPPYVAQLRQQGLCPATTTSLTTLLQNENALKLQVAHYVDGLEIFCKACYNSETDAADACFWVYERVVELQAHVRVMRGGDPNDKGCPNARAIARQIVTQAHAGQVLSAVALEGFVDALIAPLRLGLEPVWRYFEEGLEQPHRKPALKFFRAAQYFQPGLMLEQKWTPPELKANLEDVKFLNVSGDMQLTRNAVIGERAKYSAFVPLVVCIAVCSLLFVSWGLSDEYVCDKVHRSRHFAAMRSRHEH